MTERRRPTHTEEELLEQWDFLDAMVERQASQLRAGIQDAEEVDEPVAVSTDVVPRADLEALSERLVAMEAEHAAQARRLAEVEAENAHLEKERHRLTAAHAKQSALAEQHRAALGELETLRAEQKRMREQVAALERQTPQVVATDDTNSAAEVEALRGRAAALEEELRREAARRTELLDALRAAHAELETLRSTAGTTPPAPTRPHRWWRRG